MKNPYKMVTELDRAFTATPASFSGGVRNTLANLPRKSSQRTRSPVRRTLLLAAALVVCLAGAAVAAQLMGLLNLFLPVSPSAQTLVQSNVAKATLEDCSAEIREAIWDGETLGLAYVVTDPALEQVAGFKPPESGEVRLSSQLDLYGSRHMAEEVQVGDGQVIQPTSIDIRWGDTHDQVVYYLEAALPTRDRPYEIALQPYCSKGALPMRFTLDAPNAKDVHNFTLPTPTAFDSITVRVTRHRETPLRVYVDLEVLISPEVDKDAAAQILNRWSECALLGTDGGFTQMQGSISRGQPLGYQATISLIVKAEDSGKRPCRIAPLGADGQPLMEEAVTLSEKAANQ